MSCLHHVNYNLLLHSLDHVREEQKSEVQSEQAQVEEFTNLALDQGKSRCIPPIILGFSFNPYNCAMLDCALSL
jgi:hypothetical protein